METKQTAVEWLEDKINNYDFNQGMAQMRKYILQAKQMEKEQIMNAFLWNGWGNKITQDKEALDFAKKYYNETYGK